METLVVAGPHWRQHRCREAIGWVLVIQADKPWSLLVTNGGSTGDRGDAGPPRNQVVGMDGCWSAMKTLTAGFWSSKQNKPWSLLVTNGGSTEVIGGCWSAKEGSFGHGWLLVGNEDASRRCWSSKQKQALVIACHEWSQYW